MKTASSSFNPLAFPARVLAFVSVLMLGLAATACMPTMPRVHKISVQQGNVITQDMIDKLKPGMTRSQVAFIMGEPVLRNVFNDSRWDYLYTFELPGQYSRDMRMSLYFENDVLAYFTGDLAPSAAQPETEREETANVTANRPAASSDS
jgi:outer membrane protein assembly factor BamE